MQNQMSWPATSLMWLVVGIVIGLGPTLWRPHTPAVAYVAAPTLPELVPTQAVALDPKLVADVKALGIRELAPQPIGTSTAAFDLTINGQVVDRTYSRIGSLEQMYKLDLSQEQPRLWVTRTLQQSWEPRLVKFALERELEELLRHRAQQEELSRSWAHT